MCMHPLAVALSTFPLADKKKTDLSWRKKIILEKSNCNCTDFFFLYVFWDVTRYEVMRAV